MQVAHLFLTMGPNSIRLGGAEAPAQPPFIELERLIASGHPTAEALAILAERRGCDGELNGVRAAAATVTDGVRLIPHRTAAQRPITAREF
ncbi:MAG: hypothetical protein ACK4VM_13950 [Bosea sp. (in: a-proteobacteria)]